MVVIVLTPAAGAVRGNHTITLDRFVAPEDLESLPADVQSAKDIPVTGTFRDAQLFLRLAVDLFPLLLIVAAFWKIWGLLRSARGG